MDLDAEINSLEQVLAQSTELLVQLAESQTELRVNLLQLQDQLAGLPTKLSERAWGQCLLPYPLAHSGGMESEGPILDPLANRPVRPYIN